MLYRGAMTKVLAKIVHWHPDLDFGAALKSLPEDADIAVLNERIKPILSRIDKIKRLEGQRLDKAPCFLSPLQVHDQDNCYL